MNFKAFFEHDSDEMSERVIKKKVIRDGKRVIKRTSDKEGFKVVKVGNNFKEVKVKVTELIKRKKGAKKGARKSKGKKAQAQKKRERSLKKSSRIA